MSDKVLLGKLRKHRAETYHHCLRVSKLCFQVAKRIGLCSETCLSVLRAGLLHENDDVIVDAVEGHHEREDGSGYPNGGSIHKELSRVLAVCDVFDAMTQNREYKAALPKVSQMINGKLGAFFLPYVDALKDVVLNDLNVLNG